MKQKFTSLDIAALTSSLVASTALLGSRVLNIYDLSPKQFILKLQAHSSKLFLLIESGSRFHLIEELTKKQAFPSGTAMALRKHLKNKKLEKVSQLGLDRTVCFQFGLGVSALRLVVEFYAKGNVVLLDASDTIILVLRQVDLASCGKDSTAEVQYRKGHKYPFHLSVNSFLDSPDRSTLIREALVNSSEVKAALQKVLPFVHPALATLATASKALPVAKEEQVLQAASFVLEVFAQVRHNPKGFCTETDFQPLSMLLKGSAVREYSSYSEAVSAYFSSIEKEKEKRQLENFRASMESKVEKTRKDQTARIEKLEEQIEQVGLDVAAVEEDLNFVDEVLVKVLQMVALGLDWTEIAERAKKLRVDQIDMKKGRIKMKGVWLDMEKTAQQNVERIYEEKKAMKLKLEKSQKQFNKTMNEIEKQARVEVSKFETKLLARKQLVKKKFWWEKFTYFITSENLLVLAGRDAQQNEILFKKYLKNKDVWIHADVLGAASVIVKSPNGKDYPTIASLVEAGQFALCLSRAWENKIVTSAYWVFPDQVSKTAPSGEFLTTGSFMVRGRKNFLPPARLEMALGLFFLLTNESAETHKDERKPKSEPLVRDVDADKLLEEISVEASHTVPPSVAGPADSKGQGGRAKLSDHTKVESQTAQSQRTATRKAKKEREKKKKYGELSDSENELRKLLVGAAKPALAVKPVEVQPVVVAELKACYLCGMTTHLAAECAKKGADRAEDDEDSSDDEEDGEFAALQRLTTQPNEEDEVLRVIPVCAPVGALNAAKLKLKLTPGNMKRGQAASMAIKLFSDSPEIPGEKIKAAVKSVTNDDIIECLGMSNVKVNAPGAQKLKDDIKKEKKKAKIAAASNK